jgi:hypothetical protein
MKMRDQDLSRRKFLLGSSAAVVGGLLIPRGASGMVSRARRARAGSIPARITGATVNPSVYHMSNWVKGAKTFDSYVGYPLATTIQKIYMQEGQYYTAPLPSRFTQLAAVGCQFIVCVYPSRTTDESSQLSDFLNLLNSNGIVYQAALVNEWNTKDRFTPQAYLDYWRRYAPVVKAAGVPLADMVCASSNRAAFAKIKPGFPTSPLPDAYWIDFYATGYGFDVRLAASGGLLGQAEKHGVPAGIGEFGWSATGGDPKGGWSTWHEYCSYLVRLAPRLPLGCLYWGSQSVDVVTSANDPKVPGIRRVVSAFQ